MCLHVAGGYSEQLLSRFMYELQWAGGTRQRSWLRHYATSQKVPGSSPDEVDFLNLPNPSSRNMADVTAVCEPNV
jgi:hypothetical protein